MTLLQCEGPSDHVKWLFFVQGEGGAMAGQILLRLTRFVEML